MDELKKAQLQTLIKFYEEHATHGRHTELQRQAISGGLLALSGAFVAAISGLNFELTSVPLALALIAIGIMGRDFVVVYEFKWDELSARRGEYRKRIQQLVKIDPVSDDVHVDYFKNLTGEDYWKRRVKSKLRSRWRRIFVGISLVGFVILSVILFKYFC